jgi:hypothetical protein
MHYEQIYVASYKKHFGFTEVYVALSLYVKLATVL